MADIIEDRYRCQLSLRMPPDSPARAAVETVLGTPLPAEPNTVAGRILWLGPDEWLIVGAEPGLAEELESAIGEEFATVTDVSAQRTTLRIPPELLSFGCALDLALLTEGRCAQTMLAKAPVVLYREDDRMTVLVRSSFARYLETWLRDAAVAA
ncbi:sarcosine oxidase subunit gamma [Amycolatopsis suaedae]|uniref:Sarcosine oxidase subunit gamma n=1 Tax=Amycolatopsis suaedae TaxID=2510978 RepID=A0A4Q7IYL6_9PSEU|nr:sarcosine oxidase subunit gamma family protein [Amycolatopsis suaedae]RZQ60070.1 sarcosine oxidase subunit gamma [Amycolatopsis suaedae]